MCISGRRKEFDGLRFILALCVILWHSKIYIEQIIPVKNYPFRGEIANVIFFMLSGLFVTFNRKLCFEEKNSYIKFICNKLKRIYPLYLFSIIYISIMYWGKRFLVANPKLLIRHILLIQSWTFHNNASAELNGPTWFLSCLFFCWLITPIFIKCIKEKLACIFFIVMITFFVAETVNSIECSGIWRLWPIIAYFVGIILGEIDFSFNLRKSLILRMIFLMLVLILFGFSEVVCIAKCQYGVQYLLIIAFSMVLLMYMLAIPNNVINKLFKSKYLSAGGALTMNIYIIHFPLMLTWDKLTYLKSHPEIWVLLAFLSIFILAYIIDKINIFIKHKVSLLLFNKDQL